MTKAHKRRLPWALFTLCDPMLRPLQQGLFRMVGGVGGWDGWGGLEEPLPTAIGRRWLGLLRCSAAVGLRVHSAWLMPVCDKRVLATRCAGQVGRLSLLDNPL